MSDLFSSVKAKTKKQEDKEAMQSFKKQMYDFMTAAEHINSRLDTIEQWLGYLLAKDEEFIKRHANEEANEKPETTPE